MHQGKILEEYKSLINSGIITKDAAQKSVVQKLQKLQNELENPRNKGNFIKNLFAKKSKLKGLYIWGDVGRGKSMLMDLFYNNCALQKKTRVHFHAFMIDIHKKLYELREQEKDLKDPLPIIAKDIAGKYQLLCFDELQVTDIADAMILGRLFLHLFANDVIVIATSNRPPKDLYKDGLQRESFLPFIEIIETENDVIELKALKDYRLSHLQSLKTTYFSPLGKEAKNFISSSFQELTTNAEPEKQIVEVKGRAVEFERTHGDVLWVSFKEICEVPLGAEDYITISREFSTILMEDIPKLDKEHRNEAKRFVTFIDALYEHNVKFICSAEVAPDKIYDAGDGSFEFQRTVSRLIEMQSEQYLTREHLA